MTTNHTQRVNITLSDREMLRLKKLHADYIEREDTRWNPSFTGFCAMLLMDTCLLLEDGVLEFGNYGNLRRTPGRPKNSLVEAFEKGLKGDDHE